MSPYSRMAPVASYPPSLAYEVGFVFSRFGILGFLVILVGFPWDFEVFKRPPLESLLCF